MSIDEAYSDPQPPERGGMLKFVLLAVAILYVAGSAWVMYEMNGRVQQLEAGNAESQQKMAKRVSGLESQMKASNEALEAKLGITEGQLAKRTAELQRQQQAAESRLAKQQKEQMSEVTGQIEGVKGEVGGVKTDVGAVKTDLETTKSKLDRAVGDLGQQSGLIARTRDELEYLKHRGDRNYYEFTLTKSKHPTPVSTISLQLKKVDTKRGKFTMNVISDDRTIEKKDRNLFEPMQFYSGRDRQLYEIVVFTVAKDKVTGYLSTPKAFAATAAQ